MKWACALLLVLVAAGCGSDSSQSQPVGSRCKKSSDCGKSPFVCELTDYPGGYCDRPCTTDGDCPLDSLCVPSKGCRRRCNDTTELCRTDSDDQFVYGCITDPAATAAFCDAVPVPKPADMAHLDLTAPQSQ